VVIKPDAGTHGAGIITVRDIRADWQNRRYAAWQQVTAAGARRGQ
jgi:hypothetical protein